MTTKKDNLNMVNYLEILNQIRVVLRPLVADVDLINNVDRQTNLIEDLGLDSVGILQMIIGIEQEFDITVVSTDLDFNNFSSVDNLVDMIWSKKHCNHVDSKE